MKAAKPDRNNVINVIKLAQIDHVQIDYQNRSLYL